MKSLDRFIQRLRIAKAAPFIADGARVLDVGCADGALFHRIKKIGDYIGVDPDALSRELAPNARIIQGLFPAAVEACGTFDAITLLAVLEHIPATFYPQLAAGSNRLLNPGGKLIITVPSPATDHVLAILKKLRLIDGMSLEQHHGFAPQTTIDIFAGPTMKLIKRRRFQLGLNNLFVFEKSN